jgi:hypothetical protein
MQRLVSFERRDAEATVLMVTNMWPLTGREGSGIFVRRQVESLVAAGVRCDVLVVHGYLSPLAYAAAAGLLARLSVRGPRRYGLVHAHGGETALPARFYRAPLVVSYCGSDLLGAARADGSVPPSWRLRRRVVGEHARLAQATITKTAELERRLPARLRARTASTETSFALCRVRRRGPSSGGTPRRAWPCSQLTREWCPSGSSSPRRPAQRRGGVAGRDVSTSPRASPRSGCRS